jgi:3-hydroxyisobutyrate dehydrogenase-like beta-hydroxyacid dehydrogenase
LEFPVTPQSLPTAILGLGIIGTEWARNLHADGVPLAVWNRTAKSDPGLPAPAKDPAEAVRGAELIILVVADPPAVEQVLNQIEPALGPGKILAQASTVSAAWNLKFAARVEKTGAKFLEIPFTGSKPAAIARQTVFYVGGDKDLLDRAEPVLSRISATRLHIGPLGSAASLKLAMNMNIAMLMEGLSESLRFARAAGIPDEIFFAALKVNTARSAMTDLKEPKLRAGDFAPQFSLKHMDKDLRLALESAGDLDLPQLRKLKGQYDAGMAKGLGDSDFSVLLSLL